MQHLATRPWITAGVALAGASIIAVTPVTAPLPDVHVRDIQLAADETSIVIDFVRHGQSTDNLAGIIGTVAPGAALTPEGEEQAAALASVLGPPDSYAGIFASGLFRTQETAADWLTAAGVPTTLLPSSLVPFDHLLSGLNELNAGIFEGAQQNTFTGLGYIAAPLLWTLGLWFVPELGSSDYNGAAFEHYFGGAVQTMYTDALANPVESNGHITDVAFSSAAAMMIWTMMNVNNPDLLLILTDQIPNTGQIVIEGNPTEGWTLESWNGMAVPPASLLTELFVAVRNLITAPQMALYNLWLEIIGAADPTTITSAVQAGLQEVGTALIQFPESVFNDIAAALGDGAAAAGQAAGDAVTDALTSFSI